tara:strand:+ start:220 stop:1269 length:1050 start_codon:yes stop_codon:yes gene_type:complete
MERNEREICINRICSNCMIVRAEGNDYVLKNPETFHKMLAGNIYKNSFEAAIRIGILNEKDFMEQMIEKELWSKEEDEKLEVIPKLLEEAKLQLYLAYVGFKKRDIHEKKIKKLNEEITHIFMKKMSLLERCAETSAKNMMDKYLVCCNIYNMNGDRCWEPNETFDQSFSLINEIYNRYTRQQINEIQARELIQKDPWRTLWNAGKTETGIFGVSSCELSNEQKSLISWARVYDSVHESPEAPPEEVIGNNDMLDGWFIFQSRKREKDKKNRGNKQDSNVRGDEVFVFADTSQDAARIYEMNDSTSRKIVRQRQKQMENSPEGLKAQDTFDAKMEMRQMSNEQVKNRAR